MKKTSNDILISDKILKNFKSFWKSSDKYLYKVLKGGRNSAKSTHIALRIIYDLMKYDVNALVVRKVANTLTESVFEQLLWAIDHLEMGKYWKIRKNPLELTYTPRGNRILFRGADDPLKIKSIKTAKFPIAILWIEEISEFKDEDDIRIIVDSILRGKLEDDQKYSIFFSYNPPKRKSNWVNKKYNTQFLNDNVFVHHSDYRDNEYVSNTMKEEAETLRLSNVHKYNWVYLGEPLGGGVVPFENLTFRKITDDEIRSFDNIRQGLDWGYATDPLAFIRLHYDKTRRTIYLIDELYRVKLHNREAADLIKRKGYDRVQIIADSSEPKSISEMQLEGLNCKGAKKGSGSVEYGEKWLDDLNEIIIDYTRTPNSAKEFENIDYMVDKDGNLKNKLQDQDNHIIDALRYALEDDMRTNIGIINLRI